MRRIQFTPDLLPSDITGVSVFNQDVRDFEFRPGAVFANIVLGDEINRASPKTQSALLECMEERQVTVDGTTYELALPFLVVATQNPVEMEGTYPLPEAQRDRFMARVSMGYPSETAELAMLADHEATNPLDAVTAVSDAAEVARLMSLVRRVWVSPAVRQYAVDLVSATRRSPDLRLGGSPRSTLHLVRAAKGHRGARRSRPRAPGRPAAPRGPGPRPPASALDRSARRRAHRRAGRHRPPRHRAGPGGGTGVTVLRRLTGRGRLLVVVGLLVGAVGLLGGQTDVLRIGVLLLVLPVVSLLVVSRTRYRLSAARGLRPERVEAGSTATALVRLESVSRLPTGLVLLEDHVPWAVGESPRFVLERLPGGARRVVRHELRPPHRGRFVVGPLQVRLVDPFGLCRTTRRFQSTDVLTVVPQVIPLPAVPLLGDWSGMGDSRARAIASSGEDDVVPREYRTGDGLRRMHWKSTARAGRLMVRREEQPWRVRATVLIDTRAGSHRGDGPASSFEWAVSAAASVAVHLTRRGYAVRMLDLDGRPLGEAAGARPDQLGPAAAEAQLLDDLALVTPSRSGPAHVLDSRVRDESRDGLVVAVLGDLDGAHAHAVAGLRRGRATAVALVADTATWTTHEPAGTGPDPTAAVLRAAGWRVVTCAAGTDLAGAWSGTGSPSRRSAVTA